MRNKSHRTIIVIINLYLLSLHFLPLINFYFTRVNSIELYSGSDVFEYFFSGDSLSMMLVITGLLILFNIYIIMLGLFRYSLSSANLNLLFKLVLILYLFINIFSLMVTFVNLLFHNVNTVGSF